MLIFYFIIILYDVISYIYYQMYPNTLVT